MTQKKSEELEGLANQLHIDEKMSESNGNLLKVCETSSLNSSISNHLRSKNILNHLIVDSSKEKIKSTFKKTKSMRPSKRNDRQQDRLYVGAIATG